MSVISTWGVSKTRFFFELTPERVLEAVEDAVAVAGFRCTGFCLALNSFENRVYDVEIEDAQGIRSRRVVKFYRPGRWSEAQILEEHQFLLDLQAAEIPVVVPLEWPKTHQTLSQTSFGIWYSLFPKQGGRAPDELTKDQLLQVGRRLAQIHQVGASKKASHRVHLTVDSYGRSNLKYLLEGHWIPLEFKDRYVKASEGIFQKTQDLMSALDMEKFHRVHGDCHRGNLLWNNQGVFFLDFDDSVVAPAVQDLWLLVPGRDQEALSQREILLEGYEQMRSFDRTTLRLIEPLRALRFIHYTTWIARRWEDPAFPLAFPHFGTHRYWQDETEDLEQQYRLISDT